MYGPITNEKNKNLKDMSFREVAYLVPILVFIVWIGVAPKPFLNKMHASVAHLLEQVNVEKTIAKTMDYGTDHTHN
jgi:NADH-quinone oxidoreductase subunit M